MAEHITQSDYEKGTGAIDQPASDEKGTGAMNKPASGVDLTQAQTTGLAEPHPVVEKTTTGEELPIIWTPRFIATFTLVLIGGLSVASLLTQGWLNNYYRAEWVLLAWTVLVTGFWIAMIVRGQAIWIRIAGGFGCFWSLFTAINCILTWLAVDSSLPIVAYLNAATNIALFGTYICLSVAYTPLSRWDTWFFRFLPIVGILLVLTIFLFMPPDLRTFSHLASIIAAVALYFSLTVWWLRPTCWRVQPGPTFLFSMAPLILLILALPHIARAETNFFFTQVIFLCLLLGAIRVLHCEIAH